VKNTAIQIVFAHFDLLLFRLCLLVTTVLGNAAAVWVSGRSAGQPFMVHAVINYPTQYGILYPLLADATGSPPARF